MRFFESKITALSNKQTMLIGCWISEENNTWKKTAQFDPNSFYYYNFIAF